MRAQTTTSRSRSGSTSCWRACAPCCAGRSTGRAPTPWSSSATCASTWRAAGSRRETDEIHLTPIEYDLLRTLVAHPGKVLTHKAIIQEVWGPGYGESHLLRVHIAALRRKIERDPRNPELIETVTGVGYRIREPEPREPERRRGGLADFLTTVRGGLTRQ